MRKRLEERQCTEIPIDIILSSKCAPISMTTRDISASGAYILSALSFAEGELVVCSFDLPGRQKAFSFFAEVVRVDHNWDEESMANEGFGIRFIDTTAFERLLIRSHLSQYAIADSHAERSWFS